MGSVNLEGYLAVITCITYVRLLFRTLGKGGDVYSCKSYGEEFAVILCRALEEDGTLGSITCKAVATVTIQPLV